MKDVRNCSSAEEIVAVAKRVCCITKPNSEMTDDEIRAVAHWIWGQLPDTSWKDGKLVPGKAGIDLMLFVAMSEFPEFYQRYRLSQFN